MCEQIRHFAEVYFDLKCQFSLSRESLREGQTNEDPYMVSEKVLS